MIVRILGEGQFDVPDDELERLNALDDRVVAAIEAEDEDAFHTALDDLLSAIRINGIPHDLTSLDPSDLVLPGLGATLAEVRELLGDEGLIPD